MSTVVEQQEAQQWHVAQPRREVQRRDPPRVSLVDVHFEVAHQRVDHVEEDPTLPQDRQVKQGRVA